MEYTFPFSTCESPQETGVAQPFSAFVNAVNCLVILSFLLRTRKPAPFWLLAAILVFEVVHVVSHMVHVAGTVQVTVTHVLAYGINFALLFLFGKPRRGAAFLYVALIGLDLYAFFRLNVVYSIVSQALLFVAVLIYNYPQMSRAVQRAFRLMGGYIAIILVLFANEKVSCKAMLAAFPLPYHAVIELVGIGFFYTVCQTFYDLKN